MKDKNEEAKLSSKQRKINKVKEYSDWIKKSEALFLAETRLTAQETQELKRKLSQTEAEYHVIHNRLFALAVADNLNEKPEIRGFTGAVFCYKDPVTAAKLLYELVKEEKATIKFGYYNRERVGEEKIKALSELPSREELLFKVIYLTRYPISGVMNALQSPIRQFLTSLQVLKER